MKITRLLSNVLTDDLAASRAFYTTLFDFEVPFDSDWFVQLKAVDTGFELGLILRDHAVTPENARGPAGGWYPTFVVDDVEPIFAAARDAGFAILQSPTDTFYGQRQLLLRDPGGTVVDVSAPIPGFQG